MRKIERLMTAEALANKLLALLDKEDMSQQDLADCIGLPQKTVNTWLKTDAEEPPQIPIEYYHVMSRVLNVPMEYWCDGDMDDEIIVALTTKKAQRYNHEMEAKRRCKK